MAKLGKDKFYRCFNLVSKHQSLFLDKDDAAEELIDMCDNNKQFELLDELLTRFYYMDEDIYNLILNDIANHIKDNGYSSIDTTILAMAHNRESDSSQAVLDDLKIPLAECGRKFRMVSRFDQIRKEYKRGARNFIVIDDFIGTGNTCINHFNDYLKDKLENANIEFCFVAGMKEGIDNCINQGIRVYCPWIMGKGITDHYSDKTKDEKINEMLQLEAKLAKKINDTNLVDYSLGYGKTESLFCRVRKNIPNNVFPLFWWKQYSNNNKRKPLFHRIQNGY